MRESIKKYRLYCLCALFSTLVLLSGCCSAKYSYYTVRKKAEQALLAKDYKKAKNLYSLIYTNETKAKKVDTERTTWAFYRLGVISELTGDIKMARGYYWGDAMDDGFYEGHRLTAWFAQAGWKQMDELETSRTLDEILEFEKTEPEEEPAPVERKKEIIVPKKVTVNQVHSVDTTGVITATYNRSKTPPKKSTPAPFKVYY